MANDHHPDPRKGLASTQINNKHYRDMNREISMRSVFAQLIRELGESEGRDVFEWYCRSYHVTIADEAPDAIKREVFGL